MMYLRASQVSEAVGMIWLAGRRNPERPVSLSSKANEYLMPTS